MNDPILKRFRSTLEELYGDRLQRVVLFGSRARGDARPDSDYDVAVFLKDLVDRWEEMDRLADIETEYLDATGAFIRAIPYHVTEYRDRSPLMHEIRKDGLEL